MRYVGFNQPPPMNRVYGGWQVIQRIVAQRPYIEDLVRPPARIEGNNLHLQYCCLTASNSFQARKVILFGYLDGLCFCCAYCAMLSQRRVTTYCYFLMINAVLALMPLTLVVERSTHNFVSRPLSFLQPYQCLRLSIDAETSHSCLRSCIHHELYSTFFCP